MKVTRILVGPLGTNCYVLRDEESGQTAVIDPGENPDKIIHYLEKSELQPDYILNTHGHFDHIGGNRGLKDRFPEAELCIGAEDAPALTEEGKSGASSFGQQVDSPEPDRLLHEGDQLRLGSITLDVLETPGHSPGSVSLVAHSDGETVIFCGDLVFAGGVGRTDLPGGEVQSLARSIKEKILAFPDETVLKPGHGDETTVGREKSRNPFISQFEF